jgi:hypothetical protein
MPCSKVLFRTEFHCRRTRHRVAALRSHDLLHRGRSMRALMPCSKVPFRTEFHCRRTRQMLTCCAAKCLSGPSSIAKELAIEQRLLVLTMCCTGKRACVGPTKVRTSHARRRARRSRRASGARLRRVLCTMHGTTRVVVSHLSAVSTSNSLVLRINTHYTRCICTTTTRYGNKGQPGHA